MGATREANRGRAGQVPRKININLRLVKMAIMLRSTFVFFRETGLETGQDSNNTHSHAIDLFCVQGNWASLLLRLSRKSLAGCDS